MIYRHVADGGIADAVGFGAGWNRDRWPSISVNIMEFDRPDCREDITNLGLILAEGKQLLALVQQEVVAAQVGNTRCRGRPVVPATGDVM
jgi:hypothetical protein